MYACIYLESNYFIQQGCIIDQKWQKQHLIYKDFQIKIMVFIWFLKKNTY